MEMDQNTDETQDLQNSMRSGWVELFHEFANEEGELRRKEIIDLMRVCGTNPTDERVDDYFREADKDDSKSFDCEEFCLLMEKEYQNGNPVQQLREAFDFYDKDKSGFIERHELKAILKDCGEDPDDETFIDDVLQEADINGDGKIDISEFVNKLNSC